ncbi:MAG: hypothetical protein JWQ16_2300 [Novosphingobium sp.]|nr:hypothetical protein [Novosphingobium sp.]
MRRPDSSHTSAVIRRLETGERWWAAELVVRLAGLILLGLCAVACLRLNRLEHQPPRHAASPLEALVAMLTYLSFSAGWALSLGGPALFRLVPIPKRSWVNSRKSR